VLEQLHLLRDEGFTADLIVTDPPWNNGTDLEINGEIVSLEDPRRDLLWLGFMTPIVAAMHDVLADDGVLAILIDAHNLPQLGMLLNDRFGARHRLATLTWTREYVLDGRRGEVALFALVYGKHPRGVDAASETWPAADVGDALPDDVGDGFYRTAGIIELERLVGAHHHFGAKPTALFHRLVERWSVHGDVVLDPFAGCGPAGHAAHLLGRRWVLVERPGTADLARRRMQVVLERG
jgi:DNA modification methylase